MARTDKPSKCVALESKLDLRQKVARGRQNRQPYPGGERCGSIRSIPNLQPPAKEFPRRYPTSAPLHRSLCTSHPPSHTMSARITPRFALRQTRALVQRRAASSTTDAAASGANKAKEATQQTASKAQEGLSRVQSSAGSKLSSAGSAISKSLAGVGGRTGQVISFVNSKNTRLSTEKPSH